MTKWIAIAVLAAAAACSGTLPATRYYQLAAPSGTTAQGELTLVLEPFDTDAGYDDERMVYRTTPYRLDYYQYHRWSAAPGVMIGNFLEQALERSGKFRAVVRDHVADAPVILGGRVVAIEEVDTDRKHWNGRLVVELRLADARTGDVVWSQQYEETEPLRAQSPEGLARALSVALGRISDRAAPVIADLAARQQAVHVAERAERAARLAPR